ncbi:MAG: ribosome-associated translation inhibitor RaiA [Oscillospiraceae bacterium]|nr:ribosome-associated translation inhibitor RaiA [Oscillospiraceae bacterium]
MNLHFVEKKVDVPAEIREYAQKKLNKLDKYFKVESDATVTFGKEGNTSSAETTVNSDGLMYRAREKAEDYYSCIDKCVNAIEHQIHKNKTRLAKRLHQQVFVREVPPVKNEIDVDEEVDFDIIRQKRFTLKPMTIEEAILQMNLLGHEFFMFKNFEDGNAFSVVYRRGDGGYGLIVSD